MKEKIYRAVVLFGNLEEYRNEGRVARRKGVPLDRNPFIYSRQPLAYLRAWKEGWKEQDKAIAEQPPIPPEPMKFMRESIMWADV